MSNQRKGEECKPFRVEDVIIAKVLVPRPCDMVEAYCKLK